MSLSVIGLMSLFFTLKEKEIKLITDIHSLNEKELQFIKDLDNFLDNKGKILKFFNVHNGKYQTLKEIL